MEAVVSTKSFELHKYLISARSILINAGLIAVGSIVYIIGMNSIQVPNGFLSGGILGISILIHYLFSQIEIGWVYFLLNIPLIILGWSHISRRFMIYSLFGMTFFSLAANTIHLPVPDVKDPMLAAISAGVLCGIGWGLILRSVGSTGGLDILSIYLNRNFGFRIGSISFVSNISILLAGAYFYDVQVLLYSIVFLFVSCKMCDTILSGFNVRKALIVISDHADRIAQTINETNNRGVTFLNGQGAFTGKEKKVIFTITTLTELAKMKDLVLKIDPDAFMVVNDTLEVLGKRHGTGRVY